MSRRKCTRSPRVRPDTLSAWCKVGPLGSASRHTPNPEAPMKWTIATLLLTCGLAAAATAQDKKLKRSDLPPAVGKTADAQSAGATVRGYSSETEDGQLEYEVALTVNGHGKDVAIAPDGTVLEIEEEVALAALPAAVREGLQRAAGAGKIGKVESLTKKG